jgi:adenylate kinase
MVWREEEIMATELLAQAMGCGENFYVLSRGRMTRHAPHRTFRLICKPEMRRSTPASP